MSRILVAFGFVLLALSTALIFDSRWFLPPGSTAGWWCSVIGLLVLFGGLIFLNVMSSNGMLEVMSELETNQDGVEYLVRNGIDQAEARKNLNIVLGSLIIERSKPS